MPYARFISSWFANIPNINLGIIQSLLTQKGKKVKSFHFHLDFLPYLKKFESNLWEKFLFQTERSGIEYMGLDYIFASLLFNDKFIKSQKLINERLNYINLNLTDFLNMRQIADTFIEIEFNKLMPYITGTKLIGFSCSHYQLSSSLIMAKKIKSLYPDIPIIFGGKDCSGKFAFELIKYMDCIDYVGIAECEITIENLLDYIDKGNNNLCNLIYKTEDQIVITPVKSNISLEHLPFPTYDFDDFPLPLNELILPVEFGRGCPWKRCTFCPDESYNIKCQAKSAKRISEEFEHYRNISTDLTNFFILDSDALKNKETIKEIPELISNKNLSFHYAEFRAEKMDRDVLNAILHFGKWVSNFQIGIETFSEGLLRLMNKGVTVIKNVEVIKSAAELGVPIQFNLFTCYPGMKKEHLIENIKVMQTIQHLLVYENIQIFPGEFYLPADCPVFDNPVNFEITKSEENIFALLFEDFPMSSYSNYPFPYSFNNDEEQYKMSVIIRETCEAIKKKSPENNYMHYHNSGDNLFITLSRDGIKTNFRLSGIEKNIYMAALEKIQNIESLSLEIGMPVNKINFILDDFENKSIILLSSDRKSFLSLATKV